MIASPPGPVFVFRADTSEVHSLIFHRNHEETLLYTGTTEGAIHVWDTTSYKRRSSFGIGDLACLSIHSIDSYLITQDKNCRIKVWDTKNDPHICVYQKEFFNISFCKISMLYEQLAIPQPNSVVEIHEFIPTTIRFLARFIYPNKSINLGEVLQLKLFNYMSQLYTAVMYENGSLMIWNVENSSIIFEIKITAETPMGFDFDADKLQGVCGSNEKIIIFFKLDEKLQLMKKKEVELSNAGVGCLRIRPDKKILAAGCWDGKIRIFSWKTCKLLAVLECHRASILDIKFSADDSQMLVAASSDKKVSLWNIYS